MTPFHEPVFLKESIDFLVTDLSGTYVDATFGGGGHSREILSRVNSNGRVVAFDVDDNARPGAEELASSDKRLSFILENFRDSKEVLETMNIASTSGFIFDLGVSSYQIDKESGFSYKRAERLDMRLDKKLKVSAHEIVNTYPVEKLTEMFSKYGEEPHSRGLANEIVKTRDRRKIETTLQLAEVVAKVCGKSSKTLSRIFQALRIAVNDELGSLARGLDAAMDLTNHGGRIVAISYHSLEDRIVKEKFKYEAATCVCPPQTIICTCGKVARARILTRKPVLPGSDEVLRNRRARSAKMRVAERIR